MKLHFNIWLILCMYLITEASMTHVCVIRYASLGKKELMCSSYKLCEIIFSGHLLVIYIIPHSGLLTNVSSHYRYVKMSAMASQITGVSVVCSTVCSGADQRKHRTSALLAFVVTCKFPSQRASNAENVSIWWRHHRNAPPCSLKQGHHSFKWWLLISKHRAITGIITELRY